MNKDLMNSLKMTAVRQAYKKIYYFDNNGIYQSIPESKITPDTCKTIQNLHFRTDGSIYTGLPYPLGTSAYSTIIVIMALSRLQEGESLEKFVELLNTCKPTIRPKPQGIDAFICKIDSPKFYRSPNNPKKNTFDYIYIDVSILSTTAMQDRDAYLKEHIQEIRKKVIEKLENSRTFKKYGIPVNFLKVGRTTLKRKSNVLEFVFELKVQDEI